MWKLNTILYEVQNVKMYYGNPDGDLHMIWHHGHNSNNDKPEVKQAVTWMHVLMEFGKVAHVVTIIHLKQQPAEVHLASTDLFNSLMFGEAPIGCCN